MAPCCYKAPFAIELLVEIIIEYPLTDLNFHLVLWNVNVVRVVNISPFEPYWNTWDYVRNFPTKCSGFTKHRINVRTTKKCDAVHNVGTPQTCFKPNNREPFRHFFNCLFENRSR